MCQQLLIDMHEPAVHTAKLKCCVKYELERVLTAFYSVCASVGCKLVARRHTLQSNL